MSNHVSGHKEFLAPHCRVFPWGASPRPVNSGIAYGTYGSLGSLCVGKAGSVGRKFPDACEKVEKVEVGCWDRSGYVERGWGFSQWTSSKVSKFQSFKVSEFQSFKASELHSFTVSKFRDFDLFDSNFSRCVGRTFPNNQFPENNMFYTCVVNFLGLFGVSWCLQR